MSHENHLPFSILFIVLYVLLRSMCIRLSVLYSRFGERDRERVILSLLTSNFNIDSVRELSLSPVFYRSAIKQDLNELR